MTGAERVRRHRRKHRLVTKRVTKHALRTRIRELEVEIANLKAENAAAPPAPTPKRLVWRRKTLESSGMAGDAGEYLVAQVPETDEFEVVFYDGTGAVRFVGDEFRSMAEAEQAAEQHNAKRMRT
jgi:hypothetical protein